MDKHNPDPEGVAYDNYAQPGAECVPVAESWAVGADGFGLVFVKRQPKLSANGHN